MVSVTDIKMTPSVESSTDNPSPEEVERLRLEKERTKKAKALQAYYELEKKRKGIEDEAFAKLVREPLVAGEHKMVELGLGLYILSTPSPK